MGEPIDVHALLTEAGAEPRPSEPEGVWPFLFGDRRGWLWLEDTNREVVAHMSLLVADGVSEVQGTTEVLEWLPAPVSCELDHFGEGDDEFIRAVSRFPLRDGGEPLARYLLRLRETAEIVQHYELPDFPSIGRNAVQEIWSVLGDAGVAAPPVPAACRDAVRSLGPWWWGSRLFNPFSLYMFDAVGDLVERWDRTPLFGMSHAGHGVNSYGLNVIAAAGPLAAYVQHGFGGAYSDPVKDLEQIAATYARLHHVLADAERDDTPARWLLLFSNFREICELVDLERPRSSTDPDLGYETTAFPDEHALWRGLIERLPYNFGIGALINWRPLGPLGLKTLPVRTPGRDQGSRPSVRCGAYGC